MAERYVTGTPSGGPFSTPKLFDTEAQAREWTEKNYGDVLDVMDWQDEDGQPVVMFVVAD
jgi:hypothetical protein